MSKTQKILHITFCHYGNDMVIIILKKMSEGSKTSTVRKGKPEGNFLARTEEVGEVGKYPGYYKEVYEEVYAWN